MFHTPVGIFNILPNNRNIYGDASFAKYSIYPMQGLKSAFIGISIPGFAGSNIHAFYPLTFGRFHGAFKKNTQLFYRLLRLGRHTITKPLIKYPFTHFHHFIFKGNPCDLKNG